MIIVMKPKTEQQDIEKIKRKMESLGCEVHETVGENRHILGLVGDTSKIDPSQIKANRNVEKLMYVQEPYKKANRLFHPENSVISVRDRSIGGQKLAIIAGPCSVESEEQIISISEQIKESGAGFLRGGAFKPRTSPYSFQGLREGGLELLKRAREKTGLPIVTELMSADLIEKFVEDVDVIQIGARNMQNFDLLKEVGKTDKPILLKRGMSATIEELLMAAEYIMSEGNENVILCERGVRTFEQYTRNTLDLSAIPVIKKLSHLPVVVDPSHAAGLWWLVEPLAKAAIAVGADGLMIEVHNDPANAKCDGQQSITPERFKTLMNSLKQIANIENRTL
ncbi:3-deoxy-7-phosphoheptulonate synthase [Marinisporobacter balticus]|uniref:3-deoxy-D-arabinoheptulosonate-7-phosphate synthase n=1 Tax=Marinisporobacter balticus TaxID=2018667 RepID=A0A4V2SB19_9FIRM|nr:3-deoxy-7-phosphoheptulonate synthase [Marinisporobacter balticus]TCO73810.1 3-deoxy-D-arabinoheptulosonate-7-phosphate synthase [Marinisporobacter balticus]